MNFFRSVTLLRAARICICVLVVLATEIAVRAQTLPPDVGLVTKLSGDVTYQNEGYQKTPARAQAFMKIRRGDRFILPERAQVQLVYFLGSRQENWKGPAVFRVGDSESQAEGKKGQQSQPKVIILQPEATQGVRRIPVLLRRAGLSRSGVAQVRGGVEGAPTGIALTAEEEAEIAAAKENYRSMRKQTGYHDLTPELYLLGILADYEQYHEMEGVIREALKRQPDNDVLKGLMEWAHTQASP